MNELTQHKQGIIDNGFTVINNVFSHSETEALLHSIEDADATRPAFRKHTDLVAIRQFLKELPQTLSLIFTQGFQNILDTLFGPDYFVVKSIYFDKPGNSNWFVSYHQDLTISVNKKTDTPGFGPWTVKQDQFAVQPPLHILENNFTARIHLDDTDENNGALRVLPASHLKGVIRAATISQQPEEITCKVAKGGIMFMRPLLMHASSRTTNGRKRRVIHIEFSNQPLPQPLQWSEKII